MVQESLESRPRKWTLETLAYELDCTNKGQLEYWLAEGAIQMSGGDHFTSEDVAAALHVELLGSIAFLFKDPQAWLDRRNSKLNGHKPGDFLNTPWEHALREHVWYLMQGKVPKDLVLKVSGREFHSYLDRNKQTAKE